MDTATTRVIRFRIKDTWTSVEMGTFFSHLDWLYDLRFVLELIYEDHPESRDVGYSINAGMVDLHLSKREKLKISKIDYGSPGIADLVGVGAIVGHIKDFFLQLISLKVTTKQRDLENEERALRNDLLRVEKQEKLMELEEKRREVELALAIAKSTPGQMSAIRFLGWEKQLKDLIDFQNPSEIMFMLPELETVGVSEATIVRLFNEVMEKQKFFMILINENKIGSVDLLEE